MNLEIAKLVYDQYYANEMDADHFHNLLKKGLQLLTVNPNTDKLFISRYYNGDDYIAVNVALRYNQEVMIKLLLE
jgi:hypothetical protein